MPEYESLKAASIKTLEHGYYVEAIEFWHKAENSRSRYNHRCCNGEFGLLKCAKCFETHLCTLSLNKFDHDYGSLAEKLKRWYTLSD